jgi:hypothetical protein
MDHIPSDGQLSYTVRGFYNAEWTHAGRCWPCASEFDFLASNSKERFHDITPLA